MRTAFSSTWGVAPPHNPRAKRVQAYNEHNGKAKAG